MLRSRDDYLRDAAAIHAAMVDKWNKYVTGNGSLEVPKEDAPLFHAMATMVMASVDLAESVGNTEE